MTARTSLRLSGLHCTKSGGPTLRAGVFLGLIERPRRDLQYKRDRARDTAARTAAPTAGLPDGA